MLNLRSSLRAASWSIEIWSGVVPSAASPSNTAAPLGVESMNSVKLWGGPGDSLISATGRAGAGSPRRSAKTPTAPAAARMAAARTIARLLPREWGAVVWEDEATGAADRSKADPGVARRPDGLAPAGGGASVD